jgi:hypothetical protein
MFAALFSGFKGEEADIMEEEIQKSRINSKQSSILRANENN